MNYDDYIDTSSIEGKEKEMIRSLDESLLILTDRILNAGNWKLEDIVKIDDILHTTNNLHEPDNKYIFPSKTTSMCLFKNRHKIIAVPRYRGKYIFEALKNDILLPKFLYFVKSPVNDMCENLKRLKYKRIIDIYHISLYHRPISLNKNYINPDKVCYLQENICSNGIINIIDDGFGMDTGDVDMISKHVVRLIFNYTIRDMEEDEIINKIIFQLYEINSNNPYETCNNDELINMLHYPCSSQIENIISIMVEYGFFGTDINYNHVNIILNVMERLYGYNKNSKYSNPILIRPSSFILITENADFTTMSRIISRFIKYSQINQNNKYQIISSDDLTASLNHLLGTKKVNNMRIIDTCVEIDSHKFLIKLWKQYSNPKKYNKYLSKSTIYISKWNQIKFHFEHSDMTLFRSIYWVMSGNNSAEQVKEYIKSILIDPTTHSYVKKSWFAIYDRYFTHNIVNIIYSIIMYYEKVVKTIITNYMNDNQSIDVTKIIVTGKEINQIICNITKGIEYFVSLKDIIRSVDYSISISRYVSAVNTSGICYPESIRDYNKNKLWITWDNYKKISLENKFNLCVNYPKCEKDNTYNISCDHCNSLIPKTSESRRILVCDAFLVCGQYIDKLIDKIDLHFPLITLENIIKFTNALVEISIYHNNEDGISHMLDRDNVKHIIYIIYLFHICDKDSARKIMSFIDIDINDYSHD
jgi:REP element-mobilizing transposase RayT